MERMEISSYDLTKITWAYHRKARIVLVFREGFIFCFKVSRASWFTHPYHEHLFNLRLCLCERETLFSRSFRRWKGENDSLLFSLLMFLVRVYNKRNKFNKWLLPFFFDFPIPFEKKFSLVEKKFFCCFSSWSHRRSRVSFLCALFHWSSLFLGERVEKLNLNWI